MSKVMDDFGNKDVFTAEENFRPPGRNVARRGRSRFPSRLNTEYGPSVSNTKICSDDIVKYVQESENPEHNMDSHQNIIPNLQPKLSSMVDDDSCRENLDLSSPSQNRKSLTGVLAISRHRGRPGGVMKTFRNCQKFGKIQKAAISSRQHNPNFSSRTDQNFDKQLLNFLAESSKGNEEVPFIFDDVIPATPERPPPTSTNLTNRRTTFAAVIKRQRALKSFDQTGNTLDETENKESNNESQINESKSESSIPVRKLQCNPVPPFTDEIESGNVLRSVKSAPKTNLNEISQQEISHETSAQNSTTQFEKTPKRINVSQKPREQLESNIPNKLNAVFNRIKQLNNQIDFIKLGQNKVFKTKNELNQNRENVNQGVIDQDLGDKNIPSSSKDLDEGKNPFIYDETDEENDQSQETLDKCADKVFNSVKDKKNTSKKVLNAKDQNKKCKTTNEKLTKDDRSVNQGQIQEVIRKSPNPCNSQESETKIHVQVVDSLNKEQETHCDANLRKGKAVKQSKEKGKNMGDKSIAKTRKPKTTTINDVESEAKKSLPVKRQRRKVAKAVLSDEESDVDVSRKRIQPPRKYKGVNKKYCEIDDETNENFSATTSKTSITSSKICTRNYSTQSVNKLSQKPSEISVTDEFLGGKSTTDDRNVAKDPEIFPRINVSSSEDSEGEDTIIKRPKHIVPKNSEVSVNKLLTDNQNLIISEIVNSFKKNPVQDMKQLNVSLTRSPHIEKLVQRKSKADEGLEEYVEIDIHEEVAQRKNIRRSSTKNKKRRLHSDKFDDISGSETDGPKQNREIDKTKKMSPEAAQLYHSLKGETKKIIQPSAGKSKVVGRRRKKDNVADGQIKNVEVPKIVEPSTNVNFSYRKCAQENMNEKEKRLSDLFDMLKSSEGQNNNMYCSNFDDGPSDAEKKIKSKKRRVTQKKPAPKRPKKSKKAPQSYKSLIDEKMRCLFSSRPSDEGPNMFLVENYKQDSPKIYEKTVEMVPPIDQNISEDHLNEIEPNVDIEVVNEEGENRNDCITTTRKSREIITISFSKENVTVNETHHEGCDATQTCERTVAETKLIHISSNISAKPSVKELGASGSKLHVVPSGEMDTSLPSLIIENIRKDVPKDDSLSGIDFNKMKDLMLDITNTPNQTFIEADCEKNDHSVVNSVYFQPNNITNTMEDIVIGDAGKYQECPTDSHDIAVYCKSKTVHNNSPTIVNNLETDDASDAWGMMNFQQDLETVVKQKQQAIIKSLMEIENPRNLEVVMGDRSKTINSEIKYNFSSPKGEAIMVLTRINHNTNENNSQYASSESDSEESVCSIILSSRKSRRSQSSNHLSASDISDMFDSNKRHSVDSGCNEKSKIPMPRRLSATNNNNKSIGSNLLARISEESVHRSIDSTPKTIASLDCGKYLEKRVSPLRLSPRKGSQMDRNQGRKTQAIEGGDGVTATTCRNSPRKVVPYLARWKKGHHHTSNDNIGGRSSKGQVRSVSCVSTSGMSVESSADNFEPVKLQTQRHHTVRSGTFYIPKSDAERRYREVGCNMRTTMDTWLTTLTTMEHKMSSFKREINSLKEELPCDCCVRHRKNNI